MYPNKPEVSKEEIRAFMDLENKEYVQKLRAMRNMKAPPPRGMENED